MNLFLSQLYIIFAALSNGTIDSLFNIQFSQKVAKFIDFAQKYNKEYNSIEQAENSLKNFIENLDVFENHDVKKHGYSIGITKFADMSSEQFNEYKGTGCFYKNDVSHYLTKGCSSFTSSKSDLPDSVDWRDKGVVTPVKDQGQCGSCWSFSATGAMEGAWAVKTGELTSLSEQQLVDCSGKYGNMGCNGGLMDSAFDYVIDNGICTEDDIPYKAVGSTCKSCSKSAIKLSSCIDVTPQNQIHLKEAVSNGPVSIAIEADTSIFQHYTGGVISSNLCGTNLDHGVLIVGYGTENDGTMYWLVKNSWGESWGENGYIKIARSESENDPGICGIALQPSYPVC
jgi:C1A family cysteine protease